ncbi:MAG: LEA type 2 family protein [bacterium]|nr:LEA type 2 family protein [bacterium]
MVRKFQRSLMIFSALLFLGAMAGCAGLTKRPEPPEVSLANMAILNAGLFEQRYRLQLRLQNPNDFPLPIKGMKYQITINDKAFARGVSSDSVTIPAFSEALVDVEGISNLSTLVDQLFELGHTGKEKIQYRLSGSARLANQPLSIPFEYQGEFKLPVPKGSEPPKK